MTIRLKSISKALLKSTQSTREAIFNLSPPQLSEIGLYSAVHDWMDNQIDSKYDIGTSISGESESFYLEDNTKFLMFRSIRELMMNVLKHARASQLKVDFKRKGALLKVTVEDNGIGFD
jgi:signal transduction histidine kinase